MGAGGAAGIGAGTGIGGFGGEGPRSGGVLLTVGLSFRTFGFCAGGGSSRFRLAAGRAKISTR